MNAIIYWYAPWHSLNIEKRNFQSAQIHKSVCAHFAAALLQKPQSLIPSAARSNNANCFILHQILCKFSTKIININFTLCHTKNFYNFPSPSPCLLPSISIFSQISATTKNFTAITNFYSPLQANWDLLWKHRRMSASLQKSANGGSGEMHKDRNA